MNRCFGAVGLAFTLALFLIACSDTTKPDLDTTSPVVEFELAVWQSGTSCPMSVAFYIDPRGCTDNESSLGDLEARWDFDNNGEWDTEFGTLEPFVCRHMPKLPTTNWVVSGEVKDKAGNFSSAVESLEMPSWVSVPTDIIAGELSIYTRESYRDHVDTVSTGGAFDVWLLVQDWTNETDFSVVHKYYVDDKFVGECFREPFYCPSYLACGSRFEVSAGILESGEHEIRVELDIVGDLIETNLENNSATRTITVVD